ncbi:hypothetical protein GCM10010978_28610 [Compostibacillus humi]|uniref:Cupin type-2 domain-containing protein n=1 Tax=Compostibacillus humi TaxID=1245525 RepID=A0A8J2TT49_9BACI|nr:cupin domain-containing protein [Compostibacillus humi]GFZ87013.1 hypothetical protein GCM10010978_28610 [Compostibacillus humi]
MYFSHQPFFFPYAMNMNYHPWQSHGHGGHHPYYHGSFSHHGHHGHHGHHYHGHHGHHHHGHHHGYQHGHHHGSHYGHHHSYRAETGPQFKDYGNQPFVIDIEDATTKNNTFRTALWTGEYLQVTLMSIGVGEDIGLELHPDVDQFLRIEQGEGLVQMGDRQDQLNFERRVEDDDAIMVPAGKWHNLTNIGSEPLKLYSIYAPPGHPFGTVHRTKQEAMEAEH